MAIVTDPNDVHPEKIGPDGQQENYLVLSEEERKKGFLRPYRDTYKHLLCGTTTKMGTALSETYARDPSFYGGTFCVNCHRHFNLKLPDGDYAFRWLDGHGVGE